MAQRSPHELPRRDSVRQKGLAELRRTLNSQLENDLIKLLQHSDFYDLEIVVDSESLYGHSCIIKARASRFYTFIINECTVSKTTIITTVFIENASIIYIKKFLENLYSASFLPEAEVYVLKYLQNIRRIPAVAKSRKLHRSDPKLLSPDTDTFFTPKSSPSELYKPFSLLTTSQEEINLSRSQNNASVLSYYRIVSVEDFLGEGQRDTNTAFEKELAEQDELFESLKFISTKKKVPKKPATLPLTRGARPWKENKDPIKRIPHWRPKLTDVDILNKNLALLKTPPLKGKRSACVGNSSPEMDVSSSTPDSGLDTASAPMDTSEETRFDTSSFKVDDYKSEDEKPLSEGNSAELVKVSDYSDQPQNKNSSVCRLNDDEIARLDAMDRNMKACEQFLEMEKQQASRCKNDIMTPHRNACEKDESKTESHDTSKYSESVKQSLHNEETPSLPVLFTPPSSPQLIDACAVAQSKQPGSGSFFIDASSLLDEDEIASPPMSLPAMQVSELKDLIKSERESNDAPASADQLTERRQGELIFRTSIPHFSRHEVESPARLCGSFEADFEAEQVVPEVSNQFDPDLRTYSQSLNFEPAIRMCDSSNEMVSQSLTNPNDTDITNLAPNEGIHKANAQSAEPAKAVDIPLRKISVECMPIVSGGASPKDFASTSHSSSPHMPRRHEMAPIISGGMDLVINEPEIKKEKRQPSGEVWVVDLGLPKTGKCLLRGCSVEPESDSGVKEKSSPERKKSSVVKDENEEVSSRQSFPVEKSASLGYFIDFGSETKNEMPTTKTRKHRNDSSNLKKNIFSMFIDMKDEPECESNECSSGTDSTTPKAGSGSHETVNSDAIGPGKADSASTTVSSKKPLYMFIESESPLPRRKISPGIAGGPKFTFKKTSNDDDRTSFKSVSDFGDDNSLTSLESADSKAYTSHSGRGSIERDVWHWDNMNHQANETWSNCQDVHITYKSKKSEQTVNECIFKKDSTFIIDGNENKPNINELQTVIEATPPKSPKVEERDSGVIATEESDDSFVRLSDMDNTSKNPYIASDEICANGKNNIRENKRKIGATRIPHGNSRMTQSIPEHVWQQRKPSRIPEREKIMSQSTGGGVPVITHSSSSSGLARISKSLSRIFPHLTASTFSLTRTQTSDASEPNSMISSIDPYGLEVSTSETDVSCHGDGAARLGQDLLRMFLEEISPDVVVEVGGRRMKAHKCILSSRCQYFAAMLSGGWVESAGNVISLQGFSYAAVHFALCHIYSGESEIPESLNIVELATLADMLCLEGLKEVISFNLKTKYCHSFHPPCTGCIVGVLDCLPVAADYGLDDLYRKCQRWVAKYFVKVWPTKSFANLKKEHIDKCLQYHAGHMTDENVLDILLSIDKIRGSLPSIRWAEVVTKAENKLYDAAIKFMAEHFSSILTSDQFLALGKDAEWSIERLEKSLIQAAGKLSPEQACWSHARLHRLLIIATDPNPSEDMQWNESFIILLSTLSEYVQSNLIKQAPRAAKSKAWQQMEPELRSVIQEAACLVLPVENSQNPRRTASKAQISSHAPTSSFRNSTRASDLKQVKLVISQQASRNNQTSRRQQEQASRQRITETYKPAVQTIKKNEVRKSQSTSAVRETLRPAKSSAPKLAEVKSRYLQPRSPHKTVPERVSTVRRNMNGVSSSDSSRNCSPAMARAANAKTGRKSVQSQGPVRTASSASVRPLTQLAADDNMSTDSLATESSWGEREALARKQNRGKENSSEKKTLTERSIPSLPRKTQSLSSFPNTGAQNKKKTMIPRMDPENKTLRRAAAAEPRTPTGRNAMSPRLPQRSTSRTYMNSVNGNVTSKTGVDVENNTTGVPIRPPAIVSRSGTFLKDEPTILKKPEQV